MAFEASKFGTGGASGTGNVTTQVHNHFGPRDTGKTVGVIGTEGALNELTIHLDGAMVSDAAFPLLAPQLPAGALVISAYVEVEEVFTLGGTTPTINIGTEGSETTNGVEISEAQAEAVGTYDITSTRAGTWATGLTANTVVGLAMDGTTPTSAVTGKAKVVIRYLKV